VTLLNCLLGRVNSIFFWSNVALFFCLSSRVDIRSWWRSCWEIKKCNLIIKTVCSSSFYFFLICSWRSCCEIFRVKIIRTLLRVTLKIGLWGLNALYRVLHTGNECISSRHYRRYWEDVNPNFLGGSVKLLSFTSVVIGLYFVSFRVFRCEWECSDSYFNPSRQVRCVGG
jgi:hypothetical protein